LHFNSQNAKKSRNENLAAIKTYNVLLIAG
jgi:hypothetical protein